VSRTFALLKPVVQVVILAEFSLLAIHPLSAQITNTGTISDVPIEVHITRPANTKTIPTSVFGSFLEPS
jgi:hypothetical protein